MSQADYEFSLLQAIDEWYPHALDGSVSVESIIDTLESMRKEEFKESHVFWVTRAHTSMEKVRALLEEKRRANLRRDESAGRSARCQIIKHNE